MSQFAASSVLVAFDYDGTLAPIASSPGRARMRGSTRALLDQVARRYPTVVISGRSLADLSERLAGIPLWHIFGNHGLEPWSTNDRVSGLVDQWVNELQIRLLEIPGVVVENKKYSATVHYRRAEDKALARRSILGAIRDLPELRAVDGEEAVNLLVRDDVNKGIALQRARQVLACDSAIYVGDDATDEDAFGSGPPDQLLSIRVGDAPSSKALYCIPTQRKIDRLLRALLDARGRPAQAPAYASVAAQGDDADAEESD